MIPLVGDMVTPRKFVHAFSAASGLDASYQEISDSEFQKRANTMLYSGVRKSDMDDTKFVYQNVSTVDQWMTTKGAQFILRNIQ